jgi:citrate lyase beta subunit
MEGPYRPVESFRVRRSCLAVPASSERFIAKAHGLPADEVILDLEDAVAPAAKAQAKANAVAAVTGDWVEAQIEDAAGLAAVSAIAAASPRLEALVFGPADFMASVGIRSLDVGGQPAGYAGGDVYHYAPRGALAPTRASSRKIRKQDLELLIFASGAQPEKKDTEDTSRHWLCNGSN